MNEKVKVILWMNALLEPKLLNPRKTMNCWQPNPITSLESPSDSFCVFIVVSCEIKCKVWDLC